MDIEPLFIAAHNGNLRSAHPAIFIDARAIETLVEFGNSLAARGATLRIINAGARIGRVFAICGLDAMLTSGAPATEDRESP